MAQVQLVPLLVSSALQVLIFDVVLEALAAHLANF
jgi:hypothetical protein